ncbi:hypothetical protein GQ651_05900 [Alphaproteobacteria bacterium GH1-50]|uniref:Uncharacterized protein n=1 Tax=Kangsaoukella pontilimi TaxID=2691042 RepID=A0A7C9MIZ9_9RHOB|nr:SRPBCC family protein [Kangsaoukella pontilimi]MXQ07375.1 hypothetical protein [Kangsaoukella pontilimi]
MTNSTTARTFLGLNAAFSLVMGVALTIAPAAAADLFFTETASWQVTVLRLLGIGLILFGADLILMVRDRFLTKGKVMAITVMDVGWVVGSAILLITAGALVTGTGKAVILVVAAFVAIFAAGQYSGARKIVPALSQASVTSRSGKLLAHVSRPVHAPRDVVWRVMNDHPGYADVADNLSKVEVVRGDGIGMQRRCYGPKGENWLETCDRYEDGHAFGFRVHTEAEDYPYPMSKLHGVWSVKASESGSVFAIDIDITPKGSALTRALFTMAAKQKFKPVLADLADAWAARMEREARAEPAPSGTRGKKS